MRGARIVVLSVLASGDSILLKTVPQAPEEDVMWGLWFCFVYTVA